MKRLIVCPAKQKVAWECRKPSRVRTKLELWIGVFKIGSRERTESYCCNALNLKDATVLRAHINFNRTITWHSPCWNITHIKREIVIKCPIYAYITSKTFFKEIFTISRNLSSLASPDISMKEVFFTFIGWKFWQRNFFWPLEFHFPYSQHCLSFSLSTSLFFLRRQWNAAKLL